MKSASIVLYALLLALTGLAHAEPQDESDSTNTTETEEADKETAPPAAESSPSKAQEKIPSPSDWVRELQTKDALKSRNEVVYPSNVIFVEDLPKDGLPVFAKVDAEQFATLGFLRTPAMKDLEFFFAMNKRPTAKNQKFFQTPDQWLAVLLEATTSDTIVYVHKTGPWEIIQSKDGKPQTVLSKPGVPSPNAKSLHKWLISQLGYEGVILDRKGRHFLVGTLQNAEKEDTQALIVKESSDKFALSGAKADGAGLLQLVSHEAGFGVFELLLGDQPENIVNGTKIMIEKKKGATKRKKSKK